nr:hypothetical protein [Tanacetum cinerariifolium]
MTNDQANYYSRIISITVNGKNAYELKGKFLDDLHKNAFSGTNGEDAVEHIEYFLKIVDPIDLPNMNQDKLRVVVFPISLVGDTWRCFEGRRTERRSFKKAIMEGTINDDDEPSYERQKRWNVYDDTNHDHEYEMDHEVNER